MDESSIRDLSQLTQLEPYIQKLNKLKLDRYWIHKIVDGYEVYVEFNDWINKSLRRYQINLICEDEVQHWPMTYCPGMGIDEALKFFLPWADFEMDIEAHRDGSMSQWDAECYVTYDKEEGIAIHSQSFEDWYSEPDEIVPYQEDGEVESYRLMLTLNGLGRSFMEIDCFLSEKSGFHGKTFTIDDIEW